MKRIISVFLALLVCTGMMLFVFADEEALPRLVDDAELLTDSEKDSLKSKLDEISTRQKFDIVIVTVESLEEDYSPVDFADDFFDYGGYGIGDDRDGALLLINMEENDWCISTSGYGITALTDSGMEWMADRFSPELSAGNYLQAFTLFADDCDDFVTQARTGKPYDSGNLPKAPFDWFKRGLAAVVIGFLIALIVASTMKGKLNSVRMQNQAASYVVPNSLKINRANDFFLYSQVTCVKRETDGGSKGSSTHTSSSGRTHGGASGKF